MSARASAMKVASLIVLAMNLSLSLAALGCVTLCSFTSTSTSVSPLIASAEECGQWARLGRA